MSKLEETKPVAFFDMDGTILAVNSAKLWARHMWETGQMGAIDLVKSMGWLARYKMAMVDMDAVSEGLIKYIRGRQEAAMIEEVTGWYEAHVRRMILPQMAEVVATHKARGERVVLLTAASPYISRLLVADLGMDDYLCTTLEVEDGVFTGRLVRPLCYGAGKVELAKAWAKEHGATLEEAWFYTDSFTDLPMLEVVGHPVVVNPDARLHRWAKRVGWPVMKYVLGKAA